MGKVVFSRVKAKYKIADFAIEEGVLKFKGNHKVLRRVVPPSQRKKVSMKYTPACWLNILEAGRF